MTINRFLLGLSLATVCLVGCNNQSSSNQSGSNQSPSNQSGAVESKKLTKQELLQSIEDAQREAAATVPPEPVIEFPEVEGWLHTEPRSLPPESHGFSIAYEHSSGVAVTLYQFTRGHRTIPNNLDNELVKEELSRAKTGIEQAVQVGLWNSAKEIDTGIVRLGNSPKEVLWSRHVLSIEEKQMESDTYIWSFNNTMFKIRCTGRLPKNKVDTDAINELLTAIGKSCSRKTK